MARNEAKTRRELIEPKLRQAGWGEHDWQIEDEYRITDGRIYKYLENRLSMLEIAREFSCSKTHIRGLLLKHNTPLLKRSEHR